MSENSTLIACPICHGKISSAARMCPHCGHPTKIRFVDSLLNAIIRKTRRMIAAFTGSIAEAKKDVTLTFRGFVVASFAHMLWILLFGIALLSFCCLIGWATGGSWVILITIGWCCMLVPTKRRYAKIKCQKQSLQPINPIAPVSRNDAFGRLQKIDVHSLFGKKEENVAFVNVHPVFSEKENRVRKIALLLFVLFVGVVLFGVFIWFKVLRYHM